MAAPVAAVTGATGFLGRHLVRALADDGWTVRVLTRRDPVDPAWRGITPQVVLGDLANPAALSRLCRGVEAMIHGAGLIKARSRQAFDAVNRQGAQAVAEAAKAGSPDAHFLLVSSLAAREPQLSPYAASKRAGEEAAESVLGPRLSIVRPPAVYGPGDTETLALFQTAAKSPVLPVLSPDARMAVIHVADAARQIAELARRPAGTRVSLSDDRPEGYGWAELMTAAARAVGRTPRLLRIPGAALSLAGHIGSLTCLMGSTPMLTAGKTRELLHKDWSIPPGQRATFSRQVTGLTDGFRDTVEWYRQAGWLRAE